MNFKNQSHTPQLGFTLVEVLVAAAILATGLLGTATMITRSTLQDARAYHTSHATSMIEQFIEDQTSRQYNVDLFKNMTATNQNDTINGVSFSMNCILANNTPLNNCKEMTCIVTWNNKGIQSKTVNTYVFSKKY